mmetsp:Transcript_32404/g.49570  ORF Transcript_32404/g.49570 Transcript_32404/m.49570 type:complete len:387 (-) Transcript_32404:89-1249(-)|eukprot:CAMPEP_0170479734 /NCGR_PEP_ID=MMETSP0208-20121228/853_1 /TAXON_ID=197538 /ORGANISM="Strombidium inclinatum, Strain S3" /LENGTH=386 /DNA_ID=CAMNT_0010752181 /DNA_START=374 /DNA_END=1534 /DNA_ORIENTATION=-
MNFLDANFSCSDVSARQVQVLHPLQSKFSQVAVVNSGSDERHRDISLNSVDSYPGRHQRQDFGDQINESVWIVVLILASLPELVEASTSDNKGRIYFQTICTECWVLEVLLEAFNISFITHIRKVRHHMSDDFEPCVLREVESLLYCFHGMTSVRVSGDVLENTLNAHFHSGTAVHQHVLDVLLQAVVRSCFNSDTNALGLALFRVDDGLLYRRGRVSGEGIMQVSDEVVTVLLIQAHESTSHDDELHLVGVMAEALELLDSVLGLQVRIIPGTDCSHGSRLVPCITLSRVLEVRIRTSRAIHANITSHGDVRAAMRLVHHGNYSDSRGGTDGLALQVGGQLVFVGVWECSDDVYDFGHPPHLVLGRNPRLELGQVDLLATVIALN